MSEDIHPAEKAADEIRNELLYPMESAEYKQGADHAIELMKERWKTFGNTNTEDYREN